MEWWIYLLIAVALIVVVMCVIANIEVDMYLAPFGYWGKKVKVGEDRTDGPAKTKAEEIRNKNENELKAKVRDWFEEEDWQHWNLDADDGKIQLYARALLQKEHTNKWVIALHGYKGYLEQSGCYGINYYGKGYNVLLPNMRAHQKSTGKFAGMGILDKKDVKLWINKILAEDPMAEIVLHGESMGAATLMLLSAEELPSNVRVLVCDCGFTGIWNQFRHVKKNILHLPVYPMMPLTSFFSRIRTGYGFKRDCCIKALKKCSTPILFLHGAEDQFVPPYMLKQNYAAVKDCPKDWCIFAGANHCWSRSTDPELYWTKVWGFVEKFVK